MYDVIVVGARCAGSPTAMLLARAGHKVLLLDKATFPSDKLSTHYIQPQGVEILEEWGLLDRVVATGAPPLRTLRVTLNGMPMPAPPMEPPAYCPRRYLLDKILVDAAIEAGAELREAFTVEHLLIEDGIVTGVSGHPRGAGSVSERARYVVGAEGHHSLVAKSVNAPKYRERESLTGGYYSYFSGVDMDGAEIHASDRGGVLAFPTNDGKVCIAAGAPIARFPQYRADIEAGFYYILDGSPEFAARVRAGKREERWMGTADMPNFFRKPWGPGWALVGDAGYMRDAVTGLGISDAFRDANLLARALDLVLTGRKAPEEALQGYQDRRDQAAMPLYEMTLAMAAGEPIPGAPEPAH